jgi:hypothetical protein
MVRAVKTAVKYQWSSPKTKDFIEKLDRLRNSLMLATVLACRSSTEKSHDEIVAHLKEIQRDRQSRALQHKIELIPETIRLFTEKVQDQAEKRLVSVQKTIQLCLDGVVELHKSSRGLEGNRSREAEILNWLDFRQISWRYESVDKAYQQTYEWIFKTPTDHQEWDSFPSHLRADVAEPYFINGKPGSGKSTLMKFVHDRASTNADLKQWAGTQELVILHFFFWNLGTTLQKTYAGMLRGLLHAALEQYPELIPAVFPKMYRTWDQVYFESEPEFIEIKKAFELFIEKSKCLRIVILIDGIDEFEGDHRGMSLFLRSLASHHVKVIVSSRPLNSCLEPLSGCPTLRLQYLTRTDMEAYVDGELSKHHLMKRLVQQFPDSAPKLVPEVVRRAEGVFLWVKLVVRLLLEGLENGDNLDELYTRLTRLPSDLRDLYKRMFGRMDLSYQQEAAVIFQLNEKWMKLANDQSLPGLVLWYAINDPFATINHSIAPLSVEMFDWSLTSLIKRIQSRCCGLLELRHTEKTLDGLSRITIPGQFISIEEVGHLVITYMHRTVHEFITVDEVWQEIRNLTDEMQFSISTRLASGCLSTMKLARQIVDRTHEIYLTITTQLCREVMDTPTQPGYAFMVELDRTMSELDTPSGSEYDPQPYSTTWFSTHWSCKFQLTSTDFLVPSGLNYASIYTYAAERGLLADPVPFPTDIDDHHRFEMVIRALSSWTKIEGPRNSRSPSLKHKIRTLMYVLDRVTRPEIRYFDVAIWQATLVVCKTLQQDERYLEAAHLLRTMVCSSQFPKCFWQTTSSTTNASSSASPNGGQMPTPIADLASLLRSMRQHLDKPGGKEDLVLLNEIERWTNLDGDNPSSGRQRFAPTQANERSRSNGGKGKKARRARKLNQRAAGRN